MRRLALRGRKNPARTLALNVEGLEDRKLLTLTSLTPLENLYATPQVIVGTPSPTLPITTSSSASPMVTPSGIPGFYPAQIRQAYGISQLSETGAGQTIAIVDAYDLTASAITTDLNTFDSQFGLPAVNVGSGPKFTVVTPSKPKANANWDGEIALDVEWAHAVAPGANILLIEAASASDASLLTAVQTAATTAGVSVVSMSWGDSEPSNEASYNSYFETPGVSFTASSGDGASQVLFPAVSPYVTSVGGTSLSLNSSGGYGSESAWNSGGGGLSTQLGQPPYQSGIVSSTVDSTGTRAVPDVAYVADPNTGVAIYYNNSWIEVGGTSVGAPQWAGLIALANQGRVSASEATLGVSSSTPYGIDSALYQLAGGSSYTNAKGDYHDITTGSNGHPALTGYDLATGLGSPVANQLIPDLVGPGSTSKLVNVATGGTASDSGSDNSASGQGAAQAFDGSAATKWLNWSNTGYLQYQFGSGEAYVVTEYALTVGDDTAYNTGRAPSNWTFQGSNNGVTWTTLDTQTNQDDTVNGDTKTYSINNTAAFGYYRLNITANNGGSIIQLAELQLLSSSPPVNNQLTNVATGGTASDSGSDNSASGQGAAQAFDGSAATKWLNWSNTGYLQYQFGGGKTYDVTEYALTVGDDTAYNTGRAPSNWTFQGSNDGVTWTTLDTQTNQDDTVDGDTQKYLINNTAAFGYYRLNITANNGGNIIQLAELQLLA